MRIVAVALTAMVALTACGDSFRDASAPRDAPRALALAAPALAAPALAVRSIDAPAHASPVRAPRLVRCRNAAADVDHLIRLAAARADYWGDREGMARWLAAIACVESRYDNAARSTAGARCEFQFMPPTAQDYRVNLGDSRSCILAGGRYYAWHFRQWCPDRGESALRSPDECRENAAAAGNWGLGNLLDLQPVHGCLTWDCFREHAPRETRRHVHRIGILLDGGTW